MTANAKTTAIYRVSVAEAVGFFCIIAASAFRAKLCVKRAGYTVLGADKIQA